MNKTSTLWIRLTLAAAIVASGASVARAANTIQVPNGGNGSQCTGSNTNSSKFAGGCGARVIFDGPGASTNASFVQDNSPSGETKYRARMYMNLRRLVMTSGQAFDIFVGYDGTDPLPSGGGTNPVFRLEIQQNGALKQLVAHATLNSGETATAPITLQDGFRSIEISWLAGAGTGKLDLWIDGFKCDGSVRGTANPEPPQCTGLSSLSNDTLNLDYVRWGGVAGVDVYSGSKCPLPPAAAVNGQGCVDLDDFASQRTGYIGPALPFSDITGGTSHQFWRFIQGLYQAGITSGCAPNAFCDGQTVPRDQMAIFLVRGYKHDALFTPPAATGTAFGDVPAGAFGAAFIEQIKADGITSGCGGGNYCPTDPVSRAQMAIFLLRGKHGSGYTPPPATGTVFADVAAGDFAAAWIERLFAEGITSGCGGGNYCPNGSVNRGQMAVFLDRAFGLEISQVGSDP